MPNSADITDFISKVEWETTASIFVNGVLVIGVGVALALLAIGATWLISKVIKFPLSDVFLFANESVKKQIEQYKKSEKKPEPFCLSVLGLTIRAQGIRGKIMFIALLGSIAALVETVIPNDFGLGAIHIP